MTSRYKILSAAHERVERLQEELGITHLLAQILVARGISETKAAQEFLQPSMEQWCNPYDIYGLQEVVDRLEIACREKKHIVVFGDFDVDGISATATMTRGLRMFTTAPITPFIPLRFDEGYALTDKAIERLLAQVGKPDVIVTVDCGISCKNEVSQLRDQGIEVLITDHHEPGDSVPARVPVCDPKMDASSPTCILAGVGVALCVIQALSTRFAQPYAFESLCDLATLGTVADLMPLKGINRALVAHGLSCMNDKLRPCLRALLEQAGRSEEQIDSQTLSFGLIPRLNAAGRMGDALSALDLLLEDDEGEARNKARVLDEINNERRAVELDLTEAAQAQAEEQSKNQRVIVCAGEGWHEGVKGIVASRFSNTYKVPSLLFSIQGDEARGSGRSVGDINLFEALESTSDLLTRYGGHESAVGLTLPTKDLPELCMRLAKYMDALDEEMFRGRTTIDACARIEDLSVDEILSLEALAPFGQDNPAPLILLSNVVLKQVRAVGAQKNHLACTLSDGVSSLAGIMFNCETIAELEQSQCLMNVACELRVDYWRNNATPKAYIKSITKALPCAALQACQDSGAREFIGSLFDTNAEAQESMHRADGKRDTVQREGAQSEHIKQACKRTREAFDRGLEVLRVSDDCTKLEEAFGLCAQILLDNPDIKLHDCQREILTSLAQGNSVLGVLPTGRGKSLIFYLYSIFLVLLKKKQSVYIFPLRALIADQFYQMRTLAHCFGIEVALLTGQTDQSMRQEIYEKLRLGAIDIVITTPEFASIHSDVFARMHNFGLLVVDEAHHVFESSETCRPHYAQLKTYLDLWGKPQVLALSATLEPEAAQEIMANFAIDEYYVDTHKRSNLSLHDARRVRDKIAYLSSLVASGKKTLVYVSTRSETLECARELRLRLGHIADFIGFYHAGLTPCERARIEECFRLGDICALVCTSAFGEGINIPNIEHVVLWGHPLSRVQFNQIAGRAGRNGKEAQIHMLFSESDRIQSEDIVLRRAPNREMLAHVYRCVRSWAKQSGKRISCEDEYFLSVALPLDELVHVVESSHALRATFTRATLISALEIFQELDLMRYSLACSRDNDDYSVDLGTNNSSSAQENALFAYELQQDEDFESSTAGSHEEVLSILLKEDALAVDLSGSILFEEAEADRKSLNEFFAYLRQNSCEDLAADIQLALYR